MLAVRFARRISSREYQQLALVPLAGDNVQSGGTDEWVSIDDFINMVEVVANIIVDWCG